MSSVSDTEQEAGIFAWCLDTDTAYGDTAIADLFGLDPDKTVNGLPISSYMERIYADDRLEVGKKISEAVINGLPYRAEYRVLDAKNTVRHVMAFGRCFRNQSGNPVHYAGIVHPVDDLS